MNKVMYSDAKFKAKINETPHIYDDAYRPVLWLVAYSVLIYVCKLQVTSRAQNGKNQLNFIRKKQN
jgi:hypothetical protein